MVQVRHEADFVQDHEVGGAASEVLRVLTVDALEPDDAAVLEVELFGLLLVLRLHVGRAVLEDLDSRIGGDLVCVVSERRQVQDPAVWVRDRVFAHLEKQLVAFAQAARAQEEMLLVGRLLDRLLDQDLCRVALVVEQATAPELVPGLALEFGELLWCDAFEVELLQKDHRAPRPPIASCIRVMGALPKAKRASGAMGRKPASAWATTPDARVAVADTWT